MRLTWRDGQLTGKGRDRAGSFTIDGSYDASTGRCEWSKQYVGRHAVAYRGVNDGRGIWGVWELPQLGGLFTDRGGFYIWPEGMDVSEESEQTEQAVVAAMRKEFGGRFPFKLVGLLLLAGLTVGLFLLKQWIRGH
jgi:hypothetical protein